MSLLIDIISVVYDAVERVPLEVGFLALVGQDFVLDTGFELDLSYDLDADHYFHADFEIER